MQKLIFGLVLSLLAGLVQADWMLDNATSKISFVSIKKGHTAEAHTFNTLTGGVDGNGQATVNIDLNSVNTKIQVRDERMRNILFETGKYPAAILTASLDMTALNKVEPGSSLEVAGNATLDLFGHKQEIKFKAMATRVSDGQWSVASEEPVIINASDFGLTQGIDKLKEIAGLPAISYAVPVSFVLNFKQ